MLDFHRADHEDLRAAFAQVHSIWPHADDLEVHLVKRLHAVQQARAEWFVGKEKDQVVVSCAAYPMTLYGPDGLRRARGFGAVFTHPQHRGKGYAADLVRWVKAWYEAQNTQDFILYSDISPSYYERLGFHRLSSWAWTISAAALPAGDPFRLKKTKAIATNPGRLGCDYGIHREHDDDVWVLAKQISPLRKTLVYLKNELTPYWIVSVKQGPTYHLLESNLPQEASHWESFRRLVAADCAKAKCKTALGWWTASQTSILPGAGVEPRTDGILMWCSSRGLSDPWLPAVVKKGFRTFLSEQF